MNQAVAVVVLAVVAGAVFVLLSVAYRRGVMAVHERIKRESEEAEADRKQIDAEVEKRPDDQLDRDLDKFMRD